MVNQDIWQVAINLLRKGYGLYEIDDIKNYIQTFEEVTGLGLEYEQQTFNKIYKLNLKVR